MVGFVEEVSRTAANTTAPLLLLVLKIRFPVTVAAAAIDCIPGRHTVAAAVTRHVAGDVIVGAWRTSGNYLKWCCCWVVLLEWSTENGDSQSSREKNFFVVCGGGGGSALVCPSVARYYEIWIIL